jgi:hypothetical protein
MTGGVTEASLISGTGLGLYSFNTWDVSVYKSSITGQLTYQSSPRTGLAMILRNFGPIYLCGFGNMGVATAGSSASFAYSGGGMALWKIGRGQWSAFFGAHVLNTGALGGTTLVPELGIGRTF